MSIKLRITILVDSHEEVSGACDLPGVAIGYMIGNDPYDYVLSEVACITDKEYEEAPRVFDEFGGI